MQDYKTFKTKSGYCHVFADKIVLDSKEQLANIDSIEVKHGRAGILAVYMALIALLVYLSYKDFGSAKNFEGCVSAVIAIFLCINVFLSRNNSATPLIYRNTIKRLNYIKSKPRATRAYFEVFFENKNGSARKRLIMLPGSLSNGQDETEKALEIMRNENLLDNWE
jgi:hypothetical protein